MNSLPLPKAVLFDLFATLVAVPSPEVAREVAVAHILGVSGEEWHRLYYDDDILGRCLGHIHDGRQWFGQGGLHLARVWRPNYKDQRHAQGDQGDWE